MTATYKDLVDETLNALHGVTGDLEQLTSLTQSLTTGAASFTVDDASQVSRGLIEIGDELLWVKATNRGTNTITLDPGGFSRGFRQTVAATHASGDMVVNAPLFPRAIVKAAIQEVIQAVTPDVYMVTTDETQVANAVVRTYQAPAGTNWILRIEWQSIGPTKTWVPIRRWKFDPTADVTAFPTGRSVDILDPMVPGKTIKITYAKDPGALSGDGDTLATAGFGEGMRDVLVYGAAARLIAGVEAGRLQTTAVTQSNRDQLVQSGAAANASKYFEQLYLQRLSDEIDRLHKVYPTRTHLER